ncbi:MAG: SDR family oxidoreductase [Acidobacteria bacterium]|nr:SDR family oxidoreductase [Acidobacteriota bacterium]
MTGETGPLADKTAIVTGGGSGLGAATAAMLAAQGAAVVICGRRVAPLEEVVERVGAEGGVIEAVAGDVSDPESVQRIVDTTTARRGGVDILVNNAALRSRYFPTHEFPVDAFRAYLATNVLGPFLTIRAVVPHMLAAGGGSIVNVGSVTGLVGLKYAAGYTASKGALVQLTRTAALDYAEAGIRVNCVCPAGMRGTEPLDWSAEERARLTEAVGWGSPQKGVADVDHVANLIAYLCGPFAAPITGAVIPIDGGWSAR